MDVLRLLKLAALVSVVLVLNTAVVLMVTQARVPASAQSPPGCVDGDVNGDFSLDISDCVYTLQHLFESGPAPVACASGTSGGAVLSSGLLEFPQGSTPIFSGFGADYTVIPNNEALVQVPMPREGTLKNLHGFGAAGAGSGRVTVRVNGQDTPLTVLVSGSVDSNTADVVPIQQGDLVSIKLTEGTTGTWNCRYTLELE